MAWFKRKSSQAPLVPERVPTPQEAVVTRAMGADEPVQVAVASAVVKALRPFGSIDKGVVGPRVFDSIAADALTALRTHDAGLASSTDDKISRLLDLDDEEAEEPDGPGFFAYSALVATTYALGVITGEWQPVMRNLTSRFLDTLGFVDDDLGTDLYETGLAVLNALIDGAAMDAAFEVTCRQAASDLKTR